MLRSPYSVTNNVVFLVTCLFVAVFFLHSIGKLVTSDKFEWNDERSYESARVALIEEAATYKACVKANLEAAVPTGYQKIWRNMLLAVRACMKNSRFESLPITTYSNLDEDKFFVHDDNMKVRKSVVVTIGVGQDPKAEGKMKKMLSNDTEFFAADPMPENAAIYSPVGTFHQFAITSVSRIQNASVLARPGWYETRTLMHKDILSFLRELVQRDTIDNMLMDCEGAEYDLLPMFFKGREIDQAGITLCQLNAEFHTDYFTRFHEVMIQLVDDGKFIPIHAEETGHYRLFMLNIESPYCVKRYLAKYFA